jgi:hypothetical protein
MSLQKEDKMSLFATWLENAKATNLRTWLTIDELHKKLEAAEAALVKKKTVLHVVAQGHSGLQCMQLRVDGIKQRYHMTPEGSDTKVLSDLLLDCVIVKENGEKQVDIRASSFVPTPGDHELMSLSRMFTSAIQRDNFVEDALFCIDVQQEDIMYQQTLQANNFFKKFLGGGPRGPSAPA